MSFEEFLEWLAYFKLKAEAEKRSLARSKR